MGPVPKHRVGLHRGARGALSVTVGGVERSAPVLGSGLRMLSDLAGSIVLIWRFHAARPHRVRAPDVERRTAVFIVAEQILVADHLRPTRCAGSQPKRIQRRTVSGCVPDRRRLQRRLPRTAPANVSRRAVPPGRDDGPLASSAAPPGPHARVRPPVRRRRRRAKSPCRRPAARHGATRRGTARHGTARHDEDRRGGPATECRSSDAGCPRFDAG